MARTKRVKAIVLTILMQVLFAGLFFLGFFLDPLLGLWVVAVIFW